MRPQMTRFLARPAIIVFLAVLAFGVVSATQRPFVTPACAKGVAKTKTEDTASDTQNARSDKNVDTQKKDESKTDDTKSSTSQSDSSRGDSSTSRSEDSAVYRTNEQRDDSSGASTGSTVYKQGQVRDAGTPDVGGQILKREERREPDYRYRKHYSDDFYHPYDREFFSSYPYYEGGQVVIIDQATWNSRPNTWRRTYEYQRPAYGSLEEALVDIEATWMEDDAEFLMWHIDRESSVDIYEDGRFSHSVTAREVYKLTAEAIGDLETVDFHFAGVDRHGYTASARALHTYIGPDRREHTAYLTYYLERLRERWIIDRIDIRKNAFGSPNCFIATAAYGSPMEKDVLTLRLFRDERMLTNTLGRFGVAAYYKLSPPVARWIARHEWARAMVRTALRPVVQLCRWMGPPAR